MEYEIDKYLEKLEAALYGVSISIRVDILADVKSQIQDNLDSDPSKNIKDILKDVGDPNLVAARSLRERGVAAKARPTSSKNTAKWIILGFLSFMAIACISIALTISKFFPLISIDEKEGRIKILGGMIDIHDSNGSLQISQFFGGLGITTQKLSGKVNLKDIGQNELKINLTNARFSIEQSPDESVEYQCSIIGQGDIKTESQLVFDLSNSIETKCRLKIPKEIKLAISAQNGKLIFNKLINNIEVNLVNGKIGFSPHPGVDYRYNLSVKNGQIDSFESSLNSNAIEINMNIMNGKIERKE